jgi:manganese/iron transport system permease protein
MSELLVPFEYTYMLRAMWVSALVGGLCAFLSAYLMLKGWSLMGDALSHAVVPGVAIAYLLQLPYASGAFFSGIIAAFGMWGIRQVTRLKEDAVIGVVFTAFFALGLFIVSIRPVSIDVQSIVLGNILGITDEDAMQVVVVAIVAFAILLVTWKDLMLVFFDEHHAKAVGLNTTFLKVLFFSLLSASAVAALQTVGAALVIATVITPGATAYLLTDRCSRLLILSVAIGASTGFIGAYISYFVDGATGGVIVTLQALVFGAAFLFAPKHGILASRRRARMAEEATRT